MYADCCGFCCCSRDACCLCLRDGLVVPAAFQARCCLQFSRRQVVLQLRLRWLWLLVRRGFASMKRFLDLLLGFGLLGFGQLGLFGFGVVGEVAGPSSTQCITHGQIGRLTNRSSTRRRGFHILCVCVCVGGGGHWRAPACGMLVQHMRGATLHRRPVSSPPFVPLVGSVAAGLSGRWQRAICTHPLRKHTHTPPSTHTSHQSV